MLPVVYERTTRCIAGSRLGAVGFIRSVETGRVLDRVCFTFVFTRLLDLSREGYKQEQRKENYPKSSSSVQPAVSTQNSPDPPNRNRSAAWERGCGLWSTNVPMSPRRRALEAARWRHREPCCRRSPQGVARACARRRWLASFGGDGAGART